MEHQDIRLKLLQDYLDAERNLKELVAAYRQSRAEWNRAIYAARKRAARLLNDLSTGQYQQELPFPSDAPEDSREASDD